MTSTIYLSLGSNLGDRERKLQGALVALASIARVRTVSSIFETEPVGEKDQPAFLNLAAAVETDLRPTALLGAIKRIERDLGRTRTFRWGPRAIDIDILLYGDLQIETPSLSIPHRELANRAFVLVPLAEIAPDAIDPVSLLTVAALRDQRPDLASVVWYVPPAVDTP